MPCRVNRLKLQQRLLPSVLQLLPNRMLILSRTALLPRRLLLLIHRPQALSIRTTRQARNNRLHLPRILHPDTLHNRFRLELQHRQQSPHILMDRHRSHKRNSILQLLTHLHRHPPHFHLDMAVYQLLLVSRNDLLLVLHK